MANSRNGSRKNGKKPSFETQLRGYADDYLECRVGGGGGPQHVWIKIGRYRDGRAIVTLNECENCGEEKRPAFDARTGEYLGDYGRKYPEGYLFKGVGSTPDRSVLRKELVSRGGFKVYANEHTMLSSLYPSGR